MKISNARHLNLANVRHLLKKINKNFFMKKYDKVKTIFARMEDFVVIQDIVFENSEKFTTDEYIKLQNSLQNIFKIKEERHWKSKKKSEYYEFVKTWREQCPKVENANGDMKLPQEWMKMVADAWYVHKAEAEK
jgi:hypothetical protein